VSEPASEIPNEVISELSSNSGMAVQAGCFRTKDEIPDQFFSALRSMSVAEIFRQSQSFKPGDRR
jgi:hypothetical protein